MGLKIEKKEYINKTFRLDKKLIDEMQIVCKEKNITMNKLVAICLRYALDNIEDTDEQN
ncbi:hypothetical protein SAMN04515624_1524 [Eubacterium maltosivorans]|uniref:hypothetical protein n=1 Tax=Eubacterium maltosivorans TaxID=2041044 RepID=UPI00088C5F3F|nr:hypothetical protein [Eubacterium maltosivorans]WPK81369.1 hypothetical protein EUMA32_28010 [Eubacterium maltosivorans]SDP88376.1 hypothetical protein SAMN04515624_1524 [Eubacterium maltosivorans]